MQNPEFQRSPPLDFPRTQRRSINIQAFSIVSSGGCRHPPPVSSGEGTLEAAGRHETGGGVWEGGSPHKKQGKRSLRLLTEFQCKQKSHGQLSYSEAETDMMECIGASQALDITAGPIQEPQGRSKGRSSLPRSHRGARNGCSEKRVVRTSALG